jgi:hypothetical protein
MPLPKLNITVTPEDMNLLLEEDDQVRQKAVQVTLQRMYHSEKAKILSILQQLKDGVLTLDRISVSDTDYEILPEPPSKEDSSKNNFSKNNFSKEKVSGHA